jgi:hypothetical protein
VVAPCSGGGVGTPNAAFAAMQFIGPGAIGGALAGLSGWAGAGVGALIGVLAFDLSTFCPGGPNPMPTFGATDILELFDPMGGVTYQAAVTKFRDFLGNVFWPQLCHCVGGASAIPSPATYPANGPQSPPPASTGTPCLTVLTLGPQAIGPSISYAGGGNYWLGQNVTLIRVVSTAVASGPDTGYDLGFTWYGGVMCGTFISSEDVTIHAGTTTTLKVPPTGACSLTLKHGAGTTTGNYTGATENCDGFCGGGVPSVPFQQCCPTDPVLQAQLDAILSLITLVQRQLAPFAYIASTAHVGLAGTGTLAVQGLLGVKVECTTIPPSLGVEFGNPDEHFDMGDITWGTVDGYPQSVRLEHAKQLSMPELAGAFTSLAYNLHPGVVATITELVREP